MPQSLLFWHLILSFTVWNNNPRFTHQNLKEINYTAFVNGNVNLKDYSLDYKVTIHKQISLIFSNLKQTGSNNLDSIIAS